MACLDRGADDFIMKPWDRNDLLGRLRRLVRLKNALDAARSRAEEVRRILDATTKGIQGLDAQGLTTFINTAAATMLDRAPEEVIGKVAHEIFHAGRTNPAEQPCGDCLVAAVLRDERPAERFEYVFWRKDATPFPVEVSTEPIRDPDGSAAGPAPSRRGPDAAMTGVIPEGTSTDHTRP